jgi:hypothetical protein
MLGNSPYNYKTIEKYTNTFGWIFQDISIERKDPNTNVVKTIKVPIEQSTKEKWAQRYISDPNAGNVAEQKHVQIVLPRMAYMLNGFRYDSRRKLSPILYRVGLESTNATVKRQLNPVPFLFDFSLHIATRTLEDGYAIIEQFLPFFQPDFSVPIMTIPQINLRRDIVFSLTGNSQSDSFEGNFLDKRTLEWEFNFEGRGELYPPVKTKKVITEIDVNVDDTLIHVEPDPSDALQSGPFEVVES